MKKRGKKMQKQQRSAYLSKKMTYLSKKIRTKKILEGKLRAEQEYYTIKKSDLTDQLNRFLLKR